MNLLHSMALIRVVVRVYVNSIPNSLFKTYYEDFIAATMSTELTNTSKLREFIEELKKLKLK